MTALARKSHDSPLEQLDELTLARRVEHLKAIPLFEDIKNNREALQFVAQLMVDRAFKAGTHIITEGSPSSEMYILISGEAHVQKRTPEGDPFNVAILKAQNHPFFGEGALIYTEVRSATIFADSEVHCLELSRERFDYFCAQHPSWAMPFYQKVSASVLTRLRKANEDILLLYRALVSEVRGY